jgi:hypothetical protein
MMISQLGFIIALCFLECVAVTGAVSAQETEKAVRMKDLPAAVQATVREQSKGAVLRGLAQETENGQTFYEAELRVGGHGKDVLMDPTGKVVAIEEQVNFARLPPAVQTGLRKLAGKGRLVFVESITKENLLVAYEAQVKTGAKRTEIKVNPDGSQASP